MRAEVPYELLDPTPEQARQRYVHLDELAESIAQHGLLQNLVGKQKPNSERVEVIAGERRRRAIGLLLQSIPEQMKEFGKPLGNWVGPGGGAEKSGCSAGGVPIFILPATADEAAHLIENICREDLWPWELGRHLISWNDAGYGHEWIAARIGKSRVYVTNAIMLGRQLSPKVSGALEKIGDRSFMSKDKLYRIARLYDPVMYEPLHEKQVMEFERIMGKARIYTKPSESRSERIRVHERAKKLARMSVPGHAKPYLRAIYEFLFSEGRETKPNFNWK